MIILLNSSKTMDMQLPARISQHSMPEFSAECEILVKALRRFSVSELAKLMGMSEKLAVLNAERYRNWQTRPGPANSKQALLAFKGNVFDAMEIESYTLKDFHYAQQHLRILSGLYAILRPLDLVQPYRLEMATKLSSSSGKNLYEFWGDKIHLVLSDLLRREKSGILVNLASVEYFKAVKADRLEASVITPVFKEQQGSSYRMVAIYAKKARGRMCDFMIRNRIKKPDNLKSFSLDGYRFSAELSTDTQWVFARTSKNINRTQKQ